MIPTQALVRGAHLRASEKSVLYALGSRHGLDGRVYPSLGTLAADTGCSESTVKRAICSLTEGGFIAVKRGGRTGRANEYRINRETLERQSHVKVFLSGLFHLLWKRRGRSSSTCPPR
jgi:DNA-binding MarR family transcriptional regulator